MGVAGSGLAPFGTTMPLMLMTVTMDSTPAGAHELMVQSVVGFAIGDGVLITSATDPNIFETHVIASFGSMVLDAPLFNAFAAGSPVMQLPTAPGPVEPVEPTATVVQSVTPVAPLTQTQPSAVGDPHLVNVQGQRFDLMKPGVHTLLQLPMKARPSSVLLRVEADAQQVGGACADTYFMSVNITGKLAESKVHGLGQATGRGLYFVSGTGAAHTGTKWMSFGAVRLKVVHGRTNGGTPYLNFFVRNLRKMGVLVGGLLGEDDHTEAATPSSECRKVVDI